MNKAVLIDNKNNNKQIIITAGVATYLVVIIHHPQTKLTLFSHISSSDKIQEIQSTFVTTFKERNCPLAELYVYLAGGIPPFFESKQAVDILKKFWEKQPVKLNSTFLLARDFIYFDNHENYNKQIYEIAKLLCLNGRQKVPIEGLDEFFNDFISKSGGMIFFQKRLKEEKYPSHRQKIYGHIEIILKLAITELIKQRGIRDENYMRENELLAAQFIHNPQITSEKRVVINFNDRRTSVLHLVGFNANENKVFISTDDCISLINTVSSKVDSKFLNETSTLEIVDLTDQGNNQLYKNRYVGQVIASAKKDNSNPNRDIETDSQAKTPSVISQSVVQQEHSKYQGLHRPNKCSTYPKISLSNYKSPKEVFTNYKINIR